MNLQIGYTRDDSRTLSKSFTITETLTGKIKENTSIINPVFIIETPSNLNINYCYCEEFGRYYYIKDIQCITGGMVVLNCRVDVLMSYKDEIKNLSVIVDKQQGISNSNLYKDDGSYVLLNKAQNETINFPNGLNDDGEFILVVAGV